MVSIKNLIPLTIIYVTAIVFFINYVLLTYIQIAPNVPDFFKYIIYSTVFFFIYGFYISYSASDKKCKKLSKKQSTIHGIKSALYVLVTYVLIYMVLPIRQPFIELLGDNKRTSSIIETFFISLNLIISVVINYFDSIKNVCRVSPEELEHKLKKLDKYLQRRDPKKKIRNIVVKD
tara:strand:+ start:411 stop:938 length:528 start_codon:yes stop_codon:yes gene_type:complete